VKPACDGSRITSITEGALRDVHVSRLLIVAESKLLSKNPALFCPDLNVKSSHINPRQTVAVKSFSKRVFDGREVAASMFQALRGAALDNGSTYGFRSMWLICSVHIFPLSGSLTTTLRGCQHLARNYNTAYAGSFETTWALLLSCVVKHLQNARERILCSHSREE
jgi:hypothetical protein